MYIHIHTHRADLPCYIVYKKGCRVGESYDLCQFSSVWSDFVSFYIGCSSTFDGALVANGIELPNMLDIPGYTTNIPMSLVGPFNRIMTSVSMRTIAKHQVEKTFMISSQYPEHHGAPIHIGDPSRIGIYDVTVPDGYVPMFWACGATVQAVISCASKCCIDHIIMCKILGGSKNIKSA